MSALTQILIIEDELVIAYSLKGMLNDMGFNNILIASSKSKAEVLLDEHFFGLALVDINLGSEREGIEISKTLQQKGCPFIFITSYGDKATMDQALETKPAGYLIKPTNPISLYTSVKIALNLGEEKEKQFLKIKDGSNLLVICADDILFIHAENNYIKIFSEEKNHFLRMTLSNILELLDQEKFQQTHRSYIVNLEKVVRLEANRILLNKGRIPISRSFKEEIRQALVLKP